MREPLAALAAGEDGQPRIPFVLGEGRGILATMPHEGALGLDTVEVLHLMRRLDAREDAAGLDYARERGRGRRRADRRTPRRERRTVGVGGRDSQDDVGIQYVFRVVAVDMVGPRLVRGDEIDATGVAQGVEARPVLGGVLLHPAPDAPELGGRHRA